MGIIAGDRGLIIPHGHRFEDRAHQLIQEYWSSDDLEIVPLYLEDGVYNFYFRRGIGIGGVSMDAPLGVALLFGRALAGHSISAVVRAAAEVATSSRDRSRVGGAGERPAHLVGVGPAQATQSERESHESAVTAPQLVPNVCHSARG